MSLKKATDYLGNDLQVDSALKDAKGQVIHKTYQKKGELSYPTVTITLAQVTSLDPVTVQLTNEQYNVFANNKQVIVDLSELDPTLPIVVWQYAGEGSDYINYGFADTTRNNDYYQIIIDKSTKEAEYETAEKHVDVFSIGTSPSVDYGRLLAFDSGGAGTLTRNLPILTTAPSSANTEGGIIIVVLSSEPATKYSGYLYLVLGSGS